MLPSITWTQHQKSEILHIFCESLSIVLWCCSDLYLHSLVLILSPLSHLPPPPSSSLSLWLTPLSDPGPALHGQWRRGRISLRVVSTCLSARPPLVITHKDDHGSELPTCLHGPIGRLHLFPWRRDAGMRAGSLLAVRGHRNNWFCDTLSWSEPTKNKDAIPEITSWRFISLHDLSFYVLLNVASGTSSDILQSDLWRYKQEVTST